MGFHTLFYVDIKFSLQTGKECYQINVLVLKLNLGFLGYDHSTVFLIVLTAKLIIFVSNYYFKCKPFVALSLKII